MIALFGACMRRAPTPGGGGPPPWSPADLANKVAWWNASTTYCFENDAGTDPCEDTDGVAMWKDRSGGSENLIQTSAGSRPAYEATGWNAASPSVLFTTDLLFRSSGAILTSVDGDDTAVTIFLKLQLTSATVDSSIMQWENTAGSERFNIRTDNGANNRLRILRRDSTAVSVDRTGTAQMTTAIRSVTIYFSGSTISTWIDGTIDLNASAMAVGALTTFNDFRIGSGDTGAFPGRIADCVVCTGDQSASVANYHAWSPG